VILVLLVLSAWNFTRSETLGDAEAAYQRSDFPNALRLSLDHLKRRPWSKDAARVAGLCFSRLDFPDAAESYYRRSGTLSAKDANVRAYAIVRANRRDAAILALLDILKRDPNDVTALRRLGAVYMTQARWTDAMSVGEQLARLPGGEISGQGMLAFANHEAKNPELAIAASFEVLRLDPDLSSGSISAPEFLAVLALDLMTVGRAADARVYLQRILDRGELDTTWYFMGKAYYQEGAVDEAERCWKRSVALGPRLPLPWLELGRLALERNQPQDAAENLERAVALEPNLQEAYYHLAAAYRRLGRPDDAQKAWARWNALRSAHGSSTTGMGANTHVAP
jgi:tetratricopeptide (TPR) repeat protein